jgi:biotin operon repressor
MASKRAYKTGLMIYVSQLIKYEIKNMQEREYFTQYMLSEELGISPNIINDVMIKLESEGYLYNNNIIIKPNKGSKGAGVGIKYVKK